MTVLDHRELIRAGVQPTEYEVAGCITCRLECMAVRDKFDDDSARWSCGRVHKVAIPRHAGTLRSAVGAGQQKQPCRTRPRNTRRDRAKRCSHAREHSEGGKCRRGNFQNGGPSEKCGGNRRRAIALDKLDAACGRRNNGFESVSFEYGVKAYLFMSISPLACL
jgi:hypothetical protein